MQASRRESRCARRSRADSSVWLPRPACLYAAAKTIDRLRVHMALASSPPSGRLAIFQRYSRDRTARRSRSTGKAHLQFRTRPSSAPSRPCSGAWGEWRWASTFAFELAYPWLNIALVQLRPPAAVAHVGGILHSAASAASPRRSTCSRTSRARLAATCAVGRRARLQLLHRHPGTVICSDHRGQDTRAGWLRRLWLTIVWVTYLLVFPHADAAQGPHIYVANWFFLAMILTSRCHWETSDDPGCCSRPMSVILWGGVQDAMFQCGTHNAVVD